VARDESTGIDTPLQAPKALLLAFADGRRERDMSANDAPEGGVVDRDTCMGSGNCLFWAPGVFDLDEDGVAFVCGDVAGHEDAVRLAAANCPTSAIQIEGLFPS
jgi:ferredoxin